MHVYFGVVFLTSYLWLRNDHDGKEHWDPQTLYPFVERVMTLQVQEGSDPYNDTMRGTAADSDSIEAAKGLLCCLILGKRLI